jgi:hypothetical protein
VRWRRFLVFNAIGSITWAAGVTALAYGLSRSLGEIADIFSLTGLAIAGVLVVGAAAFFFWRRARRKARALEGPQERGCPAAAVLPGERTDDEPRGDEAVSVATAAGHCDDRSGAAPAPAACPGAPCGPRAADDEPSPGPSCQGNPSRTGLHCA